MSRWVHFLLVPLTAILLRLSFPLYDLHYLAWFALVPLFLLVRLSTSALGACLSSFSAGYLFYGFLMVWALDVEGFNRLNFVFLILGHAWIFAAFGFLAYHLQRKFPRFTPILLPTTWVVMEYAKSHVGFLSIPWGMLGYTQHNVPSVAWIASYTGVYGVSFLLAAVSAVTAEFLLSRFPVRCTGEPEDTKVRGRGKVSLVFPCVALLSTVAIIASDGAFAGRHEEGRTSKVALIQGNTFWDPKSDTREGYLERSFGTYSALTRTVFDSKPELIAWPSSSVPGTLPTNKEVHQLLSGMARESRSFFLVGSAGFDKFRQKPGEEKRIANSAFLFSPEGKIVARYDKRRLLPFDEYLPLRGYFPWPSWIVPPGMKDFLRGTRATVFDTGKARFGVLICSENLWPEPVREMVSQGIDFLLAMTNEGYTDSRAARHLLLAMYRFRAIENRIPVLRVDTRGVTCVFAPDGGVIAKVQRGDGMDCNVEGVLVADVPLGGERSFYARHGNVFLHVLAAVFAVFMVLSFIPARTFRFPGRAPTRET